MYLYGGPYMADVPRGSGWSQQRRDHLMNSVVIAAERQAEHTYTQRQYKQCIQICIAALETDEAADEIVVWLMRAYAQEGRYADLEQVYRRYARVQRLNLEDLADRQDPVVQVYRSLGRTQIVNNSSS
jgi:DNA-binding SARP family transcriptional activator